MKAKAGLDSLNQKYKTSQEALRNIGAKNAELEQTLEILQARREKVELEDYEEVLARIKV